MANTLFITYDGLLDPLGQSQILPYLRSIARHPRSVHILSFEKPERFSANSGRLLTDLRIEGIRWTPLLFTRKFGFMGKLLDLIKMYYVALRLQVKYRFKIAHCRSYQAMQVGCFLSRFFDVRTIFDMRGLWADDRVEGNLWPQVHLFYRLLYSYYKRLERSMLERANHIVVLTERVVPEIKKIAPKISCPISVIPCCADFEHFRSKDIDRETMRRRLDINQDDLVLSYLGSLGTVYLLDRILQFFASTQKYNPDTHLIIITQDWSDIQERAIIEYDLGEARNRIHILSASRDEVPLFLSASDIMLSFRKATYSQIACSPTKLAEAFAMGIPVISNNGIGDVDRITFELRGGALLDLDNWSAIDNLARNLEKVSSMGGERLRNAARRRFGLEIAAASYLAVYQAIEA